MEFITDITVHIDPAEYGDREGLHEVLRSYCHMKTAPLYKVKGSYEEVDGLSERLSAVKSRSGPATRGRARQRYEHLQPSTVEPVEVSALVMAYIKQKRAKELERIQGSSFIIEAQPDVGTARGDARGTVRVTLTRRRVSEHGCPVRADFVRQRFITFYQRVASDLQHATVPLSARDCGELQGQFPHLLFTPGRYKCEVTGPFGHVAKLKELLYTNAPSPRGASGNRGPAAAQRSGTPRASPARGADPRDEPCPICMEPMASAERETLRCRHSFCKDCLKRAFEYKPVCPTCGQLYGTLTGTQPEGGKMTVSRHPAALPGYEKYGTIIINYYIPSGIQKEEHPNPGQPYEGVSRTAYLPDSSEGRRILDLLRRAFDQRLIFTVGRSTTSGRNNMVTWNDIHHKTSQDGGPTHYGYPDADYLSRVRDELKVKGIE